MTETKFTPGPWFISKKFVVGPRDKEYGQSYGMIVGVADVYGDNRSEDADLIAAAPDLYKALSKCAVVLSGHEMSKLSLVSALEDAVAALAKARGEA